MTDYNFPPRYSLPTGLGNQHNTSINPSYQDYFIVHRVKAHTPAATKFQETYGEFYGYIRLDVDGTVTGVDAEGNAVTNFPVKGGIWEPTLFQSISAIATASSIWVGFPGSTVLRRK
jgi:hypothetical protein